jgi:hypothetical protein
MQVEFPSFIVLFLSKQNIQMVGVIEVANLVKNLMI